MFAYELESSDFLSINVYLSDNGVCLTVPRGCGLEQADSLRVCLAEGSLTALKAGSELPISLPPLAEAHCLALINQGIVPVGEFVVQGMVAGYFLSVVAG